MHIQQTIDRIAAVDFTYEAPAVVVPDEMLAQLSLKEKSKLFELHLSVEDIVSDIPELPGKINI